MKYLKTLLFWISLSIVLGLIIKLASPEIKGNGIYLIFTAIGLVVGLINALLTYFASNSKEKIFDEAIKMYQGKVNLNGETELIIKEKKVILDYKLEQIGVKANEYIIANIDLTDVKKYLLDNCKNKFEITENNNRIYAVIYSSWGYKGEKFKERVENKIAQINECLQINNFEVEPSKY